MCETPQKKHQQIIQLLFIQLVIYRTIIQLNASEAGNTLSSLPRGKLHKNVRILNENGRLEMITENGRFPAKRKGWTLAKV